MRGSGRSELDRIRAGDVDNSVKNQTGRFWRPVFATCVCCLCLRNLRIEKYRIRQNEFVKSILSVVTVHWNFVNVFGKNRFKSPRLVLIVQHHDRNNAQRLAARTALRDFAL
jgi:hypothetical protein